MDIKHIALKKTTYYLYKSLKMKLNDLNASYCKLSTSNHIQQTSSNEKTTVNPPPKTPKTPPTCAWGAVTCCDVCFQSVPFFSGGFWGSTLQFIGFTWFYHGIFHSSVDERLWGGENRSWLFVHLISATEWLDQIWQNGCGMYGVLLMYQQKIHSGNLTYQ